MAIEPEEEHSHWHEDEGGPIKSFLEHLEDFRWALIKSCAAIAICILLCMVGGNRVVKILERPLEKAVVDYPGTNHIVTFTFGTNRLGVFPLSDEQENLFKLGTNRYVALDIAPVTINSGSNAVQVLGVTVNTNSEIAERAQHMGMSLIILGPAQAFLVGFRVALYAGIALASPFVFFFLGDFILPALKIREKKYLYRGLAFAIPLFISGVTFCYFILMPAALAASQLYANWFGFGSGMWEAGEYIGFVCKFMLGMGLGFEMPVVILVLVKIGLLNYQTLTKGRPYMIVINLVLGAVLTTPEVFTQVLMAVPLQALYELSIFVAWKWDYEEKKQAGLLTKEDRRGARLRILTLLLIAAAITGGVFAYRYYKLHH